MKLAPMSVAGLGAAPQSPHLVREKFYLRVLNFVRMGMGTFKM